MSIGASMTYAKAEQLTRELFPGSPATTPGWLNTKQRHRFMKALTRRTVFTIAELHSFMDWTENVRTVDTDCMHEDNVEGAD